MYSPINDRIKADLDEKISAIERRLLSDVLFFYGPIQPGLSTEFKELVADLRGGDDRHEKLSIILTTPGGSASEVERCVNVVRNFYNEVDFIIPDFAYSAGTIFCMSGDNIFMNYFSVLGPIDPQVRNKDGAWVAALGYLDKVNEMIEKSKNDELSPAEFMILKELDLGELREYEQAEELTTDLLKRWLVKYKFKNWTEHRTNVKKLGKPVLEREKVQRANDIAKQLSNNKRWKSHGRPINMETLREEIRLEIHDFSESKELEGEVMSYYGYIDDLISKRGFSFCFHTRRRLVHG